MLIDWFTVAAQALNFLILIWLLKRFLYGPILRAIDAREERIAAELADADAKRAEAEHEREQYRSRIEEFDRQRTALWRDATDEVTAERRRLLAEARRDAEALGARRKEALLAEARNLDRVIGSRVQGEVLAIARKALMDLATMSLEERICEVFTRRLRDIDDEARTLLREALVTTAEPALVRTAFDLPAELRAKIQAALHEAFSAEVRVRFETAAELIGGIELTASGQKLAWSVADYLGSLEKGVAELVNAEATPDVQADGTAGATPVAERR
jgi:F-type H+-transporting ATPase subunit b